VDECKPLPLGLRTNLGLVYDTSTLPPVRSLEWNAARQELTLVHFLAQLERFYGIGGARRDSLARVQSVLGGV